MPASWSATRSALLIRQWVCARGAALSTQFDPESKPQPRKEAFLTDFKDQLLDSAYGEIFKWKYRRSTVTPDSTGF